MKETHMECYEAEELLPDYLDTQMHPRDKAPLEQHLRSCGLCRQALEQYTEMFTAIKDDMNVQPSPALREKFNDMLQSELNIEATAQMVDAAPKENTSTIVKKIPSLFLRIAASIILIASGIFVGVALTAGNNENKEVAGLKGEVKDMKETLMMNLLSQESASERIKAVSYAGEINEPDGNIVKALITTMNEDKNVNVRLAALYAVAKFSGDVYVSDALITSLTKQNEPLMQIALINILTEKKETKAKEPIREILTNNKTLPPVKEIAQKGLRLL